MANVSGSQRRNKYTACGASGGLVSDTTRAHDAAAAPRSRLRQDSHFQRVRLLLQAFLKLGRVRTTRRPRHACACGMTAKFQRVCLSAPSWESWCLNAVQALRHSAR